MERLHFRINALCKGKLYTLYAAEPAELVNDQMMNADIVMSPTQIIKDDPGLFHKFVAVDEQVQPLLSSGAQNDGGGCTLAGPGRGDCEHFVGLPDTGDVDGKPNGWCWSCWKGHQIDGLRSKVNKMQFGLEWCSGSTDFGPKSPAHEGWKKVVKPHLRDNVQQRNPMISSRFAGYSGKTKPVATNCLSDTEKALQCLSGDLSHDNVAKAKEILKEMLNNTKSVS